MPPSASAAQIVVSFLIAVIACPSASCRLAREPESAVTTHMRGVLDPLGALWAALDRIAVRIPPRCLRGSRCWRTGYVRGSGWLATLRLRDIRRLRDRGLKRFAHVFSALQEHDCRTAHGYHG